MKHCKIKCKNEEQYTKIKDVLDIRAIEYYQKAPGKAIHLCGFDKKKDIKKILEDYGIKKFEIKIEEPDFDKVAKETKQKRQKSDISIHDAPYSICNRPVIGEISGEQAKQYLHSLTAYHATSDIDIIENNDELDMA